MIYHYVTGINWKKAQEQGFYTSPSLFTEGFIHASKKEQLPGVLQRYYTNIPDLHILHIDEQKLTAPLKWELSPSLNELFPHIYGELNLDAVVDIEPIHLNTETTYYHSPIGILEIRGEEDKIAAILFTNSSKGATVDEELISFDPPSSAVILECIRQLDEYFSGGRKIFSLNLAQSGTPFQQEVWKELLNIPFGKTISYNELSKRLKNTKAIRAVGAANGNNSIAIVVPCHRVIGSNGDLVGYAGDLWRKQWLLEHEAKLENGVQMLF